MKIIDYINNAKQYIYQFGTQKPFEKIINSSEKEHYLIIPNSMVIYRNDFKRVFEKYSISEVFELSNCFLGTHEEPYILLHIEKTPTKFFRVATYDNPAHLYRDDNFDPDCGKVRLVNEYLNDYQEYLQKLDYWRMTGEIPETDNTIYRFRIMQTTEFRNDTISPRFYLENNDEVRDILKCEKVKALKSVADIFSPQMLNDEVSIGMVIGLDKIPKYPYVPEKDCEKHQVTNVRVHKGDIIEKKGQYFLINKEPDFELYAAYSCNVIRTKSISAEYLYLYLTSSISRRIRSAFIVSIGGKNVANAQRIEAFPIVLPEYSDDYYIDRFEKISNPDCRYLGVSVVERRNDSVGSALNLEIQTQIKLNNEKLLRNLVEADIKEIETCFNNKAYKAATILAGAVLEAFLIDWKSELDGKDYFENKNGKEEDIFLFEMINSIREEYEPNWNAVSTKAHMIRSKRNYVHPKNYLSKKEELSRDLCIKVIDNLKEVIESRERLTKTSI